MASPLLGIVLPAIAVEAADTAVTRARQTATLPTFREEKTVFNPGWILVAIVAIWLLSTKGGQR